MAWQRYTWLIVVHGIIAWLDAYGIGANDVANAFGTSVGECRSRILSQYTLVGLCHKADGMCWVVGLHRVTILQSDNSSGRRM